MTKEHLGKIDIQENINKRKREKKYMNQTLRKWKENRQHERRKQSESQITQGGFKGYKGSPKKFSVLSNFHFCHSRGSSSFRSCSLLSLFFCLFLSLFLRDDSLIYLIIVMLFVLISVTFMIVVFVFSL